MSVLRILIMTFALLAIAAPVFGHHSNAGNFDQKSVPIAITGSITEIELKSPHSYFWMDVKDPTGVVHNWKVEYGGPWRLEGLGYNSIGLSGADEKRILGSLKPGTVVSVEGIRAKDGTYWISFKFLSDDQGKTILDMRDVPARQVPPTTR
jgi:hypothetical protein